MLKIIGVGDNVCDKYVHTKTMYPGGQALNFSVYAKMLGADASYMGVFGNDRAAAHVTRTLDILGVEHSECRQYPGENGFAMVGLVNGDRIFLGSNRGGIVREHPLDLTESDLGYLKRFQLIHTSNNSYFDSQLEKVYSTGVPISYDFSCRWAEDGMVRTVAPYAAYVFLSCGAVSAGETKEICRELYGKGCRRVIATRGSEGAVFYDGEEFFWQKPELVEAADTLGAGDSFAAAFLLTMVGNRIKEPVRMELEKTYYRETVREALKKGAAFAAKTCMAAGAFGYGVKYED